MAEITKKEFLELLEEFSKKTLDPKFEKIDSQFAEVNSQFEKIDSRFAQIDSRFIEFREDIIHQFHVISEDVISKVQLVAEGVANLNEKLDRHIDENQREHKDILAAIKFSYAELDKRMTVLETEMEDLKRRMDKIERRSVS
jgi:chromosome condensin MukBEF ATPase and DNA-binding subunit MukB